VAREYIRSGENGMAILLDDNAAFIQASTALALDAPLRHQIGLAARRTALSLSWEAVVERLHQTLQTVLREVRHETAPSA
jgi:glycosyltransferase involved in cell wall biosynthesis